MRAQFVICSCQAGSEQALKQEVTSRLPDWRPAFSRPGLVTFKLPEEVTLDRFMAPRLTFARSISLSIGRVDGSDQAEVLADSLWELPGMPELIAAAPLSVHAWQRESVLPGDEGDEPGPTTLARAARAAVLDAAPEGVTPREQVRSETVLDVVVVEPDCWLVGAHRVRARTDRWPGGRPRLKLPEYAVSRAYLKMQEALRWSALPARPGDIWVELGCAPGGASQALLDADMKVIGVDPAEVDPVLLENSNFHHLRARSAEARLRDIVQARWLAADINAAPAYTLQAVESIVEHQAAKFRGMLLTLKLLEPELAEPKNVLECLSRVRGWGFADVRARQLATNRREFCIAAIRSRSQRRIPRGKKRPAEGQAEAEA